MRQTHPRVLMSPGLYTAGLPRSGLSTHCHGGLGAGTRGPGNRADSGQQVKLEKDGHFQQGCQASGGM